MYNVVYIRVLLFLHHANHEVQIVINHTFFNPIKVANLCI